VSGLLLGQETGSAIVLDNASVRVFRGTRQTLAPHLRGVSGVVVPIRDGEARKAGEAYWAADASLEGTSSGARDQIPRAAAARGARDGDTAPIVVVEPKPLAAAQSTPPGGSKPGDAPFVGMSFRALFETPRVSVIRARMEVDAREGVHTHASDTIVVHLSGGEIEDTADGRTTVLRWKPGDVEFEARGSSHSARNVGRAVDVVLVALKP
jgi:quercetin dioxygenase-like cupin family protein